jgi:heme A synthase
MTTVLSIGAFINFLVIIVGVPVVLWREKPKGSGGLIWWVIVALLVAVFALVSLLATLLLATSASTLAHLVLVLVVLLIVFMFFTPRGAPTRS